MKHYQYSLMKLDFKLNLSQVGACASCHAAEFHGTKQYANEAVAKHRAVSRDVRHSIAQLLATLDRYDSEVEKAHDKVVALVLPADLDDPQPCPNCGEGGGTKCGAIGCPY